MALAQELFFLFVLDSGHQRSSLASPTPQLSSTSLTHTTPSIYVINAAALSKPHAIEQLTVRAIEQLTVRWREVNNYNIDLAAVTETYFKAKHCDSIVAIPDYTLLRRDRTRHRGGGVAVYARIESGDLAILRR